MMGWLFQGFDQEFDLESTIHRKNLPNLQNPLIVSKIGDTDFGPIWNLYSSRRKSIDFGNFGFFWLKGRECVFSIFLKQYLKEKVIIILKDILHFHNTLSIN